MILKKEEDKGEVKDQQIQRDSAKSPQSGFKSSRGGRLAISISSSHRNLMKTYHNEANTSGTQKLHQKFFWSFSNKVVRFRKIAILQPSFSNKLFLKLNLSKKMI